MASDKPLVVITGAGGLIGRRLIDRLSSDYTLVGLERDIPLGKFDIRWIETDLTDDASVAAAMDEVAERAGNHIASVVHLAAYYDFSGDESPLYDQLTVEGTWRLLNALEPFEVEQFLFSSSLLVMQPTTQGEPIDEFSPTRAEWAYPESKLKAEGIIREHSTIPSVILRIAGAYDEDGNSLPLSQHITRIHEKRMTSYVYPGNEDHGQALVHLDDLADAVAATVERRRQLGNHELFLIAEPDVMTYGELQDRLGELLHGDEWPTIRIPAFIAKAGAWVQEKLASSEEDEPFIKPWMVDLADDHYEADISKANEQLGWHPKHRLRDTLPEIVRRFHQDAEAWYRRHSLPVPDELVEAT